ncbi:hypothetical protein E0K93_01910 [Puniceibacterium sp. HSS470]|nr:hypothetical protein E0K93_01910 [Puniceibacterium sp. HSS470]
MAMIVSRLLYRQDRAATTLARHQYRVPRTASHARKDSSVIEVPSDHFKVNAYDKTLFSQRGPIWGAHRIIALRQPETRRPKARLHHQTGIDRQRQPAVKVLNFQGKMVHPIGFEPMASAFGAINRGLSEMRDAARHGTLTY